MTSRCFTINPRVTSYYEKGTKGKSIAEALYTNSKTRRGTEGCSLERPWGVGQGRGAKGSERTKVFRERAIGRWKGLRMQPRIPFGSSCGLL